MEKQLRGCSVSEHNKYSIVLHNLLIQLKLLLNARRAWCEVVGAGAASTNTTMAAAGESSQGASASVPARPASGGVFRTSLDYQP